MTKLFFTNESIIMECININFVGNLIFLLNYPWKEGDN